MAIARKTAAPSVGLPGPVLCRSMADAQIVLRRLADPSTRAIVYDAETTGLSWRKDVIVGHVITFSDDPRDTYYVPVRHGERHEGNIHPHRARLGHPFEDGLRKIASTRRDLLWIAHNTQFDMMFLWGHGIPVLGNLEDTAVNAALLNEFAPSYSLEACCRDAGTTPKLGEDLYKHLAAKFGGQPVRRAQMGNFWKLPGNDPLGFDYAAGDGSATWSLRQHQLKLLEQQDLLPTHALESAVTRVVYRMTRRGIKIDQARLGEVISNFENKVKESLTRLPDGFNVRSALHIREFLTKEGCTDWPLNAPTKPGKPGNPRFDEAWLKTHEPGQRIIAVRKYSHLLNSFAYPLRDEHLGEDGRVHATFHQTANDDYGTVTGRFSCSQPNLQQIPKRNEEIALPFRSLFVSDEGMEWWDADLSQCEPRLLAHYSGARVLLEGYLSCPVVDAHQAVANAAAIDREDGKRLNQTLITGGGIRRVREMIGDRAEEVYEKYFAAMPEIKKLQKNASRRFETRGYLITLLGRRARLESRDKSYKGVNRLLQTGNAEIIKKAMVEIDTMLEADGDRVHMLNTVHDALSFQAAPEHESMVMEALRVMTDFGPGRSVPMRVPMAADYGRGPNWAVASFPKAFGLKKGVIGNFTQEELDGLKRPQSKE